MDISFAEIDRSLKPVYPEIYLAKPDRTILAPIKDFYNDSLTVKLGNISELTFTICYENSNVDNSFLNSPAETPITELVKHRYLLKVVLDNATEWFVITGIKNTDSQNKDEKIITAYSLGFELADKNISNYNVTSYNLEQVVIDALSNTIWSIEYIDPVFNSRYRGFDISASITVLDFIFQIAETFNALVVWNTGNRTLSFYQDDNIGSNKGLVFNYSKYLNSLTDEQKSDELVTSLYVKGKDGLTISRVTPTGTPTIEDFSYFLNPFTRDELGNVLTHSDYMSDGLCNAILDYNELLETKTGEFGILLNQKDALEGELTVLENELFTLNSELDVLYDNLDIANASEQDNTLILADINTKENEISAKELEITNKKADIDAVDTNIETLRNEVSIENNFTAGQIVERNQFIIQAEYYNEYCDNDEELYELALEHFQDLKIPKSILNIDIINFLEVVECQHDWDKLSLGDIVTIKHEIFNINVEAKIIEINYNFNDGNISLTISNVVNLLDTDKKYIEKLFSKTVSTSATVDMSKYKWAKIGTNESNINSILTDAWDAASRRILAGVNESVSISRRGIIITNPSNSLEKIIMQSGILALSKDGGNNWQTAITADGIVAERLLGQIIAALPVGEEGGIIIDGINKRIYMDANNYWDATGIHIPAANIGGTLAAGQITVGPATNFAPGYNPQEKITTFFQTTPPTPEVVGDLWIKSDNDRLYRWDGVAWTEIQDADIIQAVNAAATAQATADGKVTTFFSTTTPTAEAVGDLWYNSTTQELKRWNGTAWDIVANYGASQEDLTALTTSLGDMAYENAVEKAKLGTTVIDGGYLVTGMVDASRIDTGILNAARIGAGSITADHIATGQIQTGHIHTDGLDAGTIKTGLIDVTVLPDTVLRDDVTYNGVQISPTVGVKVTHADSSYSQMTGDGFIASRGNFLLKDDVGVMTSITDRDNLVNDHSFELLKATGSEDPTYWDFAVDMPDNTSGNIRDWRRNSSPRLISFLQTGTTPYEGMFGHQSVACNSSNWVEQYVSVEPGRTYTISGYVTPHPKRNTAGASVKSRFYVGFYNDTLTSLSSQLDVKTLTTSHVAGQTLVPVRHTVTVTTPANCYFIRIILYASSDGGWVIWDGLQMVDGSYPVVYNPEEQLWALCRGVSGGPRLMSTTFYPENGSGKIIIIDDSISGGSGTEPVIHTDGNGFGALGNATYPWWRVYSLNIYRNNEYSLSDERLKENIVTADKVGKISSLRQMDIKEYNFISTRPNENMRRRIGPMAQQVDSFFTDEDRVAINVDNVLWTAVAGIQELFERVERLEAAK